MTTKATDSFYDRNDVFGDVCSHVEDKDAIILRLRVELATERAKRKELLLMERDASRERARTEHALERALVDERVHGLELEAMRVKLEREVVSLREEKENRKREKEKERRAMERLAEKSERAKRREEKVVKSLREEIEEMRDFLEKEREEKRTMESRTRKVEEVARKLEFARTENDWLTKRVVSSEKRLEQALMENVERRQEAKKNERTLKRAVHLSAELLARQRHRGKEDAGIKDEAREDNRVDDEEEEALYT